MKRWTVLFFLVLGQFLSLEAQNKLVIYTSIDSAMFIPYINGERYLMAPTDSFDIELDTNRIDLIVHFSDSTVSDIYKRISFDKRQTRHFRIVSKPKLFQSINSLGLRIFKPHEYDSTKYLRDYYMLKDEDFLSFNKK